MVNMSEKIERASVSMEFFCMDPSQEVLSSFFDSIKAKIERSGIESHFRIGLKSLDELEIFMTSLIGSRSFGMNPTFYFDIIIKPDIVLGTRSVVPTIEISLGVAPPSCLHIIVFSKGNIREVSKQNLSEKLNLTESLIVKLLDDVGLASWLNANCGYRWIFWDLTSALPEIRDLDYWKSKLKDLISNNLFPLKEVLKGKELEKYVFQNGDVLMCTPPKCLVHAIEVMQRSDLCFRSFAIHINKAEEDTSLHQFLFNLDEIFITSLTTLRLSTMAEKLEKRVGEIEYSFGELMKQLSERKKTSDVFPKVEKLEPLLWNINKDQATFAEQVSYLTRVVRTRNLSEGTEMLTKEVGEKPGVQHGLISEFSYILSTGIRRLSSEASLLTIRFKNLNDEFNSLKSALATRIQIELERRNLSIQTALGLLQIIAVMVFSFQLLTYFYPFINDFAHILLYVLAILVPPLLVLLAYIKMISLKHA
jgi:hypothetical protein